MRTGVPGRALCSRVSMCKLGARAQGEIREHRAGEEVRKGRGAGATLVRANRAEQAHLALRFGDFAAL